jgi:hypothetical protein
MGHDTIDSVIDENLVKRTHNPGPKGAGVIPRRLKNYADNTDTSDILHCSAPSVKF